MYPARKNGYSFREMHTTSAGQIYKPNLYVHCDILPCAYNERYLSMQPDHTQPPLSRRQPEDADSMFLPKTGIYL